MIFSNRRLIFLSLTLLVSILALAQEQRKLPYLPVVLIHGILADKQEMKPTIAYLQKYLPDVYIKNVEVGLGTYTSYWNMTTQGEWLAAELQDDPNLRNGFNIVAHSQGGLLARYYIEHYNSPHVYNYITWGTPQMGVFGMPGSIDNRFFFLNYLELSAYRILYNAFVQKFIGVAGYWRDTTHYDLYLSQCSFLPYLNNEKEHPDATHYKENICSLQNMVLVQSDGDDIIEPLESCHFCSYKIGSSDEIEPLEKSAQYTKDLLGLRTLAETGRLHLKYAHCTHIGYQEDEQNFVENTLPFLTLPF